MSGVDSDTQVVGANANPAMLADGYGGAVLARVHGVHTRPASVAQPSRCNSDLVPTISAEPR